MLDRVAENGEKVIIVSNTKKLGKQKEIHKSRDKYIGHTAMVVSVNRVFGEFGYKYNLEFDNKEIQEQNISEGDLYFYTCDLSFI